MSRRIERVNGLLREEISLIIAMDLRDPRLSGMVSVTSVHTSPDLQHANVYVSILEDDEDESNALRALNSASGFIHRNLGKRVSLRRIPSIEFHIDKSIAKGEEMLRFMDDLFARDTRELK